jgi:hypothetical protein
MVFLGFGEDWIVLGGRKGRLWVGCIFLGYIWKLVDVTIKEGFFLMIRW